jgi:hypothetical protein
VRIDGNDIHLDGCEVAAAIAAYLVAHGVHYTGPRTIRLTEPERGAATGGARVHVDPGGRILDSRAAPDDSARDRVRAWLYRHGDGLPDDVAASLWAIL